jgi:hypothetical protein
VVFRAPMSQGNRRHQLVLRGCLIAGILFASAALGQGNYKIGPGNAGEASADQRQPAEPKASAFREGQKVGSDTYSRICDEPPDREYAELCQRWRVAEAIDKQVEWSRWQFIAVLVAIGALVATLLFTGWSASAASRAATVAKQAVHQAREAAQHQLRAYVFPTRTHIAALYTGEPKGILRVRNFGQTPAHEVSIWIDSRLSAYPLPEGTEFRRPGDLLLSRSYLGPGAEVEAATERDAPLTIEQIKALEKGTWVLLIVGDIRYRDEFDNWHHTTFRYAVGGPYGIPANRIMAICEAGNDSA